MCLQVQLLVFILGSNLPLSGEYERVPTLESDQSVTAVAVVLGSVATIAEATVEAHRAGDLRSESRSSQAHIEEPVVILAGGGGGNLGRNLGPSDLEQVGHLTPDSPSTSLSPSWICAAARVSFRPQKANTRNFWSRNPATSVTSKAR